jgi:hypothetical protein
LHNALTVDERLWAERETEYRSNFSVAVILGSSELVHPLTAERF